MELKYRWIICCGYAVFVLGLSITPSAMYESAPRFFPHQDKLLHLWIYGGLAIVLGWTLQRQVDGRPTLWSLLIVATAALYGALMEVLQAILPFAQRTFSWGDMAANLGGAVLGMVLFITAHGRITQTEIPRLRSE